MDIGTVTIVAQSVHHLPADMLEDADAMRPLVIALSMVHATPNVLQALSQFANVLHAKNI